MSAFSSIIKNPTDMNYDGKDNDETILYVLRRSSITNIPWAATVFVLLMVPFITTPIISSFTYQGGQLLSPGFIFASVLFWYVFTFGYFLTNFFNWYFNILLITSKKIVDMDFVGISYKNISETVLENVEDVTSNINGPFGTIFNIGSIFIQTAAEKREFEFTDLYDPSTIRDAISDLVAAKRNHNNNGNN